MNEPAPPLPMVPPEASIHAGEIDALFFTLTSFTGVVLLVLYGLIWWFAIRYRARRPARRESHEEGTERWEILWTLSPLLIYFGFFFWAADLYIRTQEPPPDSMQVQVIGRQWMWEFYHPDGTRELNELHVPTGVPVRLLIASEDVIHSLYLPAFRLKQDAVPGRLTQAWFEATREGTYHLHCAEYCGTRHSRMGGSVTVLSPEDYRQWLETGDDQAAATIAQGRELYNNLGCRGCHAPESTVHAPSLTERFGRMQPLADGSMVRVDEAYLRDSILLPEKHVAAGYPPIMPSYAGQIEEGEIAALVAYIRSLQRPEDPREGPQ